MEKLILDYHFDSENLSNPDGSSPVRAINCSKVPGPGNTEMGVYSNALFFGSGGKITVVLPVNKLNKSKFCVRCLFKIDTPVLSRQNLLESNALPFAMFLDKTDAPNAFKVAVTVAPKNYGWSGTDTGFFMNLNLGTWYVADLVYDTDTVSVFINGDILSVHAFPSGKIDLFTGTNLYMGTWVDQSRNQFQGAIAGVQIYDGIPMDLESQLDEKRSSPEWFLSYKYEDIKQTFNFGFPKEKYKYDYSARAYIQIFATGLIMYNESAGAAFEMHGAIFNFYKNYPSKKNLCYLVSDEGNAGKTGCRKIIFQKGGIYWSPSTGAVAVTGQIYLDYELMGEAAAIGMPVQEAIAISNGKEQKFQIARMYHKNNSPKALEVRGAILTKFINTGGVSKWGYPVSNETSIKKNNVTIGKLSEFEVCTIYFASNIGAFEVHGSIREKYLSLKGPLGELGFPTSDETDIPNASGAARYNTFQTASILWFGTASNMFVCSAFKIFLGRINSKESEGFMKGQNDLYLRTTIEDNGHQILSKRFPSSGEFGGQNIVEIKQKLPITIVPNSPNRVIKFTVDIWESDWPDSDEHLGIYSKTLNMSNAWGMKDNNGVYNSGSFSQINSITWAVQPDVDISKLTEIQKWWGVANKGTSSISYANYASAFRDVDSESEWWDVTDWLEKAFYELVAKDIAADGNCFGMSLEGIYSRKLRSIFNLPIDRFTTWSSVVNEFNIKHQYQVGASAIWWFVGQFLSGNTHDPVDVFNATRDGFRRGDNPVLCITQYWDFSGAPHCIMPIEWDSSSKPWKLKIFDPIFPLAIKEIQVNPDKNEFTYNGNSTYKGGEWSGGRLHYMPYCILDERPRTPIWDAILLLLAGTIIILGEDTSTASLTDENGVDLDAFGIDSVNRMKQGKSLNNKFVSFKGFDGKNITTAKTKFQKVILKKQGVLKSEMYLRSEKESSFLTLNPDLPGDLHIGNMTFNELLQNKKFADIIKPIITNNKLMSSLKHRELKFILNDPKTMEKIDKITAKTLKELVSSTHAIEKNFNHKLIGNKNGSLKYILKSKLNQMMITSGIKLSEINTVGIKDLGTNSSMVNMTSSQNKLVTLEIENKLGVRKDKIKIKIDKIPVDTAKQLSLNIQPGLAGLDILTTAQKVNANVSFEAIINGKSKSAEFKIDIEGGVRIRPSTYFSNDELTIGKIDNLFGQLRSTKTIKSSK